MEITMDDAAQHANYASEAFNLQSQFFAAYNPGDDDEPEDDDAGESQEDPEADPEIVHSPVVPQTGGKPK